MNMKLVRSFLVVMVAMVMAFGSLGLASSDVGATNATHCSVAANGYSSGGRVIASVGAYCGSSHYGLLMLKVNGGTKVSDGWRTGQSFQAAQSRTCSPGVAYYIEPFAALFSSGGRSISANSGGFTVICQR